MMGATESVIRAEPDTSQTLATVGIARLQQLLVGINVGWPGAPAFAVDLKGRQLSRLCQLSYSPL